MMFGEAASESPRVPSPWTKARSARSSGSRSSNNSTPLSIRKRSKASAKVDADEDAATLSTPPTEEEGEEDGFFSLDVDFSLDRLDLNAKEECSATSTSLQKPVLSTSSRPPRPSRLAPEPDALGNLEYKLRLLPPTRHRYDRLLTQLKWRLLQGGGTCTYEIGVLDDGRCIGICPTEMRVSLRVLANLASELGAFVRVRRAFALVESDQPSKSGKTNQLRSMSNDEAQSKLLADDRLRRQAHEDVDVEDVVCACKAGEELLACTEGVFLSKSAEKEGADGVEAYEVIIEDAARDEFIGETWMGESDGEGCRNDEDEDEGVDEIDLLETEEGQEFTFSLSLDEMNTRQAGFQRRAPRRRCRYKAKGAQIRRKKVVLPDDVSSTTEKAITLQSTVSDGPLLQEKKEALATDGTSSIFPCGRIIVEAVVYKLEDEEDKDSSGFIDYDFL